MHEQFNELAISGTGSALVGPVYYDAVRLDYYTANIFFRFLSAYST